MKKPNVTYLLEKTANDQAGDNRRLFLAALIMEKCLIENPGYSDVNCEVSHIPAVRPHVAAKLALKLGFLGANLQQLAVLDCNEGLSERQERSESRYREQFTEIAEGLGFGVEFGGDPRGCVAKLIDPSDPKAGDNWGGGWGVY